MSTQYILMKHSFWGWILVVPHNRLAQTPLLSPGPAQLAGGEQRMSSFQKVVVVFTGNSSICVQIGWLCVRHSDTVLDFPKLMLQKMRSGGSNFSGCSKCKLKTFIPDLKSLNTWVWDPLSVFNGIHKWFVQTWNSGEQGSPKSFSALTPHWEHLCIF